MSYRNTLLSLLLWITSAASAPSAVPIKDVKAVPNKELTNAFVNLEGWTGGDAAYSVPLSTTRSLWLFGDTFIGKIQKRLRKNPEMVHNTAAWMDVATGKAPAMHFFWRQENGKPSALLEPTSPTKTYYWPSAITPLPGGKLAVFCKMVVDKAIPNAANSAFGFDWIGQDLALVENPNDDPTCWKYTTTHLPGGEAAIYPGSACMLEDEYVYVYGTIKAMGTHPVVLMRIRANDLAEGNVSKFEYWARKVSEEGEITLDGNWSKYPVYPITLFDHGAPEMSVSKIKGLPGYWAVYTENGLGPNIMLRHADKPEGPWSTATRVYSVPEFSEKLISYAAKHHPELADEERTLVITYCLNPGGLKEHVMQPMAYFPKAITVRLTPGQ